MLAQNRHCLKASKYNDVSRLEPSTDREAVRRKLKKQSNKPEPAQVSGIIVSVF
jgi:hypothetical protein